MFSFADSGYDFGFFQDDCSVNSASGLTPARKENAQFCAFCCGQRLFKVGTVPKRAGILLKKGAVGGKGQSDNPTTRQPARIGEFLYTEMANSLGKP